MAVSLVQQLYRIRTDATAAQGGTPVWLAAQNTVATPPTGVAFRIRFAIASTGSTSPATSTYNLYVSRNGGAYAQIPTGAGTNPVYSTDATASASADNSAITTSLLTGATGTFQSGQYDSTGATSTFILTAANYTEIEFGIAFQIAQIANGDTFAFQVQQAATPLTTYTVTPTLTIVQAATQAQATQAALEAWTTNPAPVAQVTQVALEAWYSGSPPPAQVTQAALEMWASVTLYTPPPFIPPPPSPGPGKGKGKGPGGKGGGQGQPRIQFGSPALAGEVERFEAVKPRRHRPIGVFPPALAAALTLSESAGATAALAATVRYAAGLSASALTADLIAGGKVLAALLAAGSTATDAFNAGLGAKAALAESSHAAEALSATAKMLAQLAASSATSDASRYGVRLPATLSESAATSAALTALLAAKGQLAEGATTSAVVAGFRTLVAAISESGAGSAALAGNVGHGAPLAEGSATHDALSAAAKLLGALAEAAAAGDGPAATAILRAVLAEAASTFDADTYVATTHPLRHSAKLIGEQATPDLAGEWREPRSSG